MVAGGGMMVLLGTWRLMLEVGMRLVMWIVLKATPGVDQVCVLLVPGPHVDAQVEIPGSANLAWIVVRTWPRTRLEIRGTVT